LKLVWKIENVWVPPTNKEYFKDAYNNDDINVIFSLCMYIYLRTHTQIMWIECPHKDFQ